MDKRITKNKARYQYYLICFLLISGTIHAQDLIFKSGFENNTKLVHGMTQGLASSGLLLKLTSEQDEEFLEVNNPGVFTFFLAIAIGTNWQVEIIAMPSDPVAQNCLLTNNSGVMTANGVNNLTIICDATVSKWNEMNWNSALWQ